MVFVYSRVFTGDPLSRKVISVQRPTHLLTRAHLSSTAVSGFSLISYTNSKGQAHGENFMTIFTTLSVVIWFSTGTLEIFATLVYVFTMRVVIYDILSMAIIPTLSTSILFCNLCYILLLISPRSVVKIAIRI